MKIRKLTFTKPKLFRRLNAPYRMVLINDESLDEVASFRLTKGSVYILFSTLFVLTIAITVAILVFSPMKYYIPGYGNNKTRVQMIRLKQTVDSLSDMIKAEQEQAANIRKVINGDYNGQRDTALLNADLVKKEAMSILPQPEEIKKTAIETVKQEARRKRRR